MRITRSWLMLFRTASLWLAHAHERAGCARSGRVLIMLMAAIALATPAFAMDDQATYWRFDGRAEKRLSGIAPATEWAASAWIGDDSTKLRLHNSGIVGDSGHIDNEGGTKGIDSRFFYSRLIADFWDAKAGVSFTVFDGGVTRSGFVAGVEGLAPYGIHVDA